MNQQQILKKGLMKKHRENKVVLYKDWLKDIS